jgi:hypothetical protein
MLKQRLMLDITYSNRHQIRAQVDQVKSHWIASARDNMSEHYDLHGVQSAAEHL